MPNELIDKAQRLFPIQVDTIKYNKKPGRAPEAVYMRAYEVYCAVYGEQAALIDLEGRDCRGGFSTGELVAFLYARSFPQNEWRARVDEAFQGLNV